MNTHFSAVYMSFIVRFICSINQLVNRYSHTNRIRYVSIDRHLLDPLSPCRRKAPREQFRPLCVLCLFGFASSSSSIASQNGLTIIAHPTISWTLLFCMFCATSFAMKGLVFLSFILRHCVPQYRFNNCLYNYHFLCQIHLR